LINEMSAIAKPPAPQRDRVPMALCLEQARQHWQQQASLQPDQISLTISDRRTHAYVDNAQLRIALDAILANATAAGRSDSIRVQINSRHDPTDDTVVVSVGDNGSGMAPEVLRQACEPFFSHRPAGRGRGLGLTRAARLVENNGGRLWIESAVGVGTTVHLVLPASPPSSDHTLEAR
jgi:signal transduction histidine kinase